MSKLRMGVGLAAWIAVSFIPAWIGSQATDTSWYTTIDRPGWAPPGWVFGPVWTTLYLLMGIAAWLVWKRSGFEKAQGALVLFLVHLVFNAAWSWIFFGMRRADLAFAEVLVLWAMIIATIYAFQKHHTVAAWLLAPYLLWVTFASVLTYTIWQMNPSLGG